MAYDVEEVDADGDERVLERAGAIDVAKASAKVCVRLPGSRRRITRVWDVATTTNAIVALADELAEMESSESSSRPPRTTGGRSSTCSKREGSASGS